MTDTGSVPSVREHDIVDRRGDRGSPATVREGFAGNSIEGERCRMRVDSAVQDEIPAQSSGVELFWGGVMPRDGKILTKRITRRAVRAKVPIGIRPSLRLDPTR